MNQLSIGRYLTGADARFFKQMAIFCTATDLNDVAGYSRYITDIYIFPGIRTGLGEADSWSAQFALNNPGERTTTLRLAAAILIDQTVVIQSLCRCSDEIPGPVAPLPPRSTSPIQSCKNSYGIPSMSRRMFTPDPHFRLEGRVVLSAVGPVRRPFGLSAETYGVGSFQLKNAFPLYGNSGDYQRLRTMLAADSLGVPDPRATGLGPRTNAILDQMQTNLQAYVPHAIVSAMYQTLHGIHTEVVKRIRSRVVFVVRSA